MDIIKYKTYIRDMQVTDDELKEIIADIINDISADIKIFRTTIGFTLSSCLDEYNIKTIFNLSSTLDDQVTDIKFKVKSTDEVTTIIELANTDSTCSSLDTPLDLEVVTTNSGHIFLGVTELLCVHKSLHEANLAGSKTLVEDVTEKYFEKINDYTFIAKHDILTSIYGKIYELNILANCNYKIDIEHISDEQENILKPAIIAGLKYFLSDMYLNANNEQVSNILYQRYWAAKKQIRNNLPQLIGTVSEFRMAEWNK